MFTVGAKGSTSPKERKSEKLEEQYKPLRLKAVLAAASQRKPEEDKRTKGNKKDLPACLQDMEEV